MNWDIPDLSPEEDTQGANKLESIHQQNEEKRLIQLKKFQDPNKDERRKTYVVGMSRFGQLIVEDKKAEIVNILLAKDCEIFLFNSRSTDAVQYAFGHEGFIKLFKDLKILKREVKETNTSLKGATGFQICYYEMLDETKDLIITKFSYETFSFVNDKITKYTATYGSMPMDCDLHSLFMPTRKEKMLAKIKELNYAWTDQPDLERIASLLHESTEYKIWRWKDNKYCILDKNNFATEFNNGLEEDFVIKSIVPYDAYCENQYVVGSYVYYLEGKRELSGQKFMWVSTCIYAFDQDLNLKKINQNGEFYDEDEILIPFETNPREKIIEKISKLREIDHDRDTLSVMCNEGVQYTFDINIFGNSKHFFSGQIKGLSQFDSLRKLVCNVDHHMEQPTYVDVFEDIDDPSYDAIILRDCSKGKMNLENSEKEINFYHIVKYAFENGKLAKVVMFPSILSEAIPSPYDDINFIDLTVRPKSEFL